MDQSVRNLAVIGAQWGDEGKGKIVDLLSEEFDIVARYHGGHNAGHTVKFADQHYSLHLIPSGILHPGKLCVLGNGMVIDPKALLEEMDLLRGAGVVIEDNLKVSDAAQVILPYHRALDVARESAAGSMKIGTTGRGIGPAYESKIARCGILVGDLLDRDVLGEKVRFACREKNQVLMAVYGIDPVDPDAIVAEYAMYGEMLRDRITNTTLLVHDAMKTKRRILFEGAQGTMLDVDHGTYPYVTSSSCVVGGICSGLGIPPKAIDRVAGVVKAYSTRVGGGPMPTELNDEMGEHLRRRGNEYGTTTGRPRRTGWLDLPILRTAMMLNGIDEIALTKLDVFDELAEIPVCTSYKVRGTSVKTYPHFAVARGEVTPELRVFRGWQRSTAGIQNYAELPQEAKDYIEFMEGELECKASIVSTGPRREETIIR